MFTWSSVDVLMRPDMNIATLENGTNIINHIHMFISLSYICLGNGYTYIYIFIYTYVYIYIFFFHYITISYIIMYIYIYVYVHIIVQYKICVFGRSQLDSPQAPAALSRSGSLKSTLASALEMHIASRQTMEALRENLWFRHGLYMVSVVDIWLIYELYIYMIYIWLIYDLYMIYIWFIYGLYMDNPWTICG